MTTPYQSPVVPITAETQNSDIPFPCHMWSSSKAQLDPDGNGWVWVEKQDWSCELCHTMFTHYCQNPPDWMPGGPFVPAKHGLSVAEAASGRSHGPLPTPTASGDPCARAAEMIRATHYAFNPDVQMEAALAALRPDSAQKEGKP